MTVLLSSDVAAIIHVLRRTPQAGGQRLFTALTLSQVLALTYSVQPSNNHLVPFSGQWLNYASACNMGSASKERLSTLFLISIDISIQDKID
jgi:hypothetical protein